MVAIMKKISTFSVPTLLFYFFFIFLFFLFIIEKAGLLSNLNETPRVDMILPSERPVREILFKHEHDKRREKQEKIQARVLEAAIRQIDFDNRQQVDEYFDL